MWETWFDLLYKSLKLLQEPIGGWVLVVTIHLCLFFHDTGEVSHRKPITDR